MQMLGILHCARPLMVVVGMSGRVCTSTCSAHPSFSITTMPASQPKGARSLPSSLCVRQAPEMQKKRTTTNRSPQSLA